jgi:uncharacterized protein (DUF1697 family)
VPTAIAFLRAINVGGRFIKMAELAAHFETLGLTDVSTYINSGNVLFTTRARDLSQLAARIERDLEPLLGFRSEVFLRTPSEVHAVAAAALSHRSAVPESGEVNVAFLTAELNSEQLNTLLSLRTDIDDFAHAGREVYWLCKGNQMNSKFSNAVMERRLRLRCTFRRVSMLAKLSEQLLTAGDA